MAAELINVQYGHLDAASAALKSAYGQFQQQMEDVQAAYRSMVGSGKGFEAGQAKNAQLGSDRFQVNQTMQALQVTLDQVNEGFRSSDAQQAGRIGGAHV